MKPPKTYRETGIIGPIEKRTIEIVDYRAVWPEKFQEHAAAVRDAVRDKVLEIHHIGSTSVPGLAAKPIIDMLLVVGHSGDEDGYVPQLVAAGYQLRVREPDFHEHRMLRTLARDVHLHVYSAGSIEIERYLLFRDRLREHAKDRRLYEETKRKLAVRDWENMDHYAQAKTEVVEAIIARARGKA